MKRTNSAVIIGHAIRIGMWTLDSYLSGTYLNLGSLVVGL